jgi:hypothetical protein
MTAVINLDEARRRKLTRQATAPWRRRFGREFNPHFTAADVPDEILAALISGDAAGNLALNEFILGARGCPPGQDVASLDRTEKMIVLEAFLLLIDLFRFEAMHRLQWVADFDDRRRPVLDLVLGSRPSGFSALTPPAVLPTHPDYPAWLAAGDLEKPAFLRKSIPTAIIAFRQRAGSRT